MKIQMLLLLLCFVAVDSYSQANQRNRATTNVHHYRNNITVRNFDGVSSTININGSLAILTNSNGGQSTIDLRRNSSTLITTDGTIASVVHNGLSSTVTLSDGEQFIINHMQSTSSFSTIYGKHTINHTFGFVGEICHKSKIDVLIHVNWLIRQRASEETVASNEEK